MSSLPHEREAEWLRDLIEDTIKFQRNETLLIICPQMNQCRFLTTQAHRIAESFPVDQAKQIKIFREGLEFDSGTKVQFTSYHNPHSLRGLKPDRVILMGEWAEFWYILTTMITQGSVIEAIA